jgi:hypothetical protein
LFLRAYSVKTGDWGVIFCPLRSGQRCSSPLFYDLLSICVVVKLFVYRGTVIIIAAILTQHLSWLSSVPPDKIQGNTSIQLRLVTLNFSRLQHASDVTPSDAIKSRCFLRLKIIHRNVDHT